MEYIPAKTIVTRTKNKKWFGADYNMNIYKGCCHGCIYCDSRSECYHIENFDIIRAKENALQIIRDDLRRKIKTGVVATGAMSDPYNPFEKRLELTRHALELVDAYQFGIAIATKSDLITRDIDILQSIYTHSPVICKISITTADDALARKIEPYAPLPSSRFAAIKELRKAGIFTGILLMPVLPFLEDTLDNILQIIHLARECDANFIYPFFGVTLRQNQREWYYQKLDELFPEKHLKQKYQKYYQNRYNCTSFISKKLYRAFSAECDKLKILYQMQNIIKAYQSDRKNAQLTLFCG